MIKWEFAGLFRELDRAGFFGIPDGDREENLTYIPLFIGVGFNFTISRDMRKIREKDKGTGQLRER